MKEYFSANYKNFIKLKKVTITYTNDSTYNPKPENDLKFVEELIKVVNYINLPELTIKLITFNLKIVEEISDIITNIQMESLTFLSCIRIRNNFVSILHPAIQMTKIKKYIFNIPI